MESSGRARKELQGSSRCIAEEQQRHRQEHEEANAMLTRWGVRLTVKPLLGTPSYRSKPTLSNAILKPIVHRINGDLYSWFQMLNLMAFLSSAMARQITDGNLI